MLKVEERQGGVVVYGLDIDLKNTFECGQCFRWNAEPDGSYTGVAYGKALNVSEIGDGMLYLKDTSKKDLEDTWYYYFDMDKDYSSIAEALKGDEILDKAMRMGRGIRILRQDPWECLISFIISANNRIPQIKRVVENICRSYGDPVDYMGRTYYTFPGPERLAAVDEETLKETRCGFRASYIIEAARMVQQGFDLKAIYEMDIDEARSRLKEIPGVGDKVADCILLFAYGKTQAFPVDVWVKKVLTQLYGFKDSNIDRIRRFAESKFGDYAGYAQQYLFYYMREKAM
ncbi:DNA-3-methyladenine glycosylase family protein [Caldanaerobius polysaccharolyticus]|uniref:DNA-3-methyladenine glycosylase family protein n=1 Tax=Caldanaerobius polysaccharolyticus TaxID=44256 RepID=UPI00047E3E02|nr:DNA glycosylase [Caldanaerobius polysaccharolyticus]